MSNNELTILLYHGVTDTSSQGIENCSGKHVAAELFRDQMKYLSENCNVLSMDDVVSLFNEKKGYPSKSVAITFDDGFRNNYSVAAPILEKFKIPATFYITAGIVNTNLMFWVDILEDCLNLTEQSEIKIHLESEKTFPLVTQHDRIYALTEIKKYCKLVESDIKNLIINQVVAQSNVSPSIKHSNNYEKISWHELMELNKNPLFTIGGHSLYHDILSGITPKERLEKDISLSIDLLEYNLGTKIQHYAYPEGQYIHYNETVIEILKKKGIVCCPSAVNGTNTIEIDMFNLKRIMVGFNGTSFPL